MEYREIDLIKIAKRENNKKRSYLVVNPLQGKHVPVSPKTAFEMMDALAGQVRLAYPGERLLLAGFAETATAIGARLAVKLGAWYIQTTREDVKGADYLYFTESHSHATEQRLVKDELDTAISQFDRVVFVEDEVTTGNTILKIVKIMEQQYPGEVRFSVASLLNGMDQDALLRYQEHGIEVHYLLKTDHSSFDEVAERFDKDGKYVYLEQLVPNRDTGDIEKAQEREPGTKSDMAGGMEEVFLTGYLNARRLVEGRAYGNACENLWMQISDHCPPKPGKSYLVLGTEEFMYPALFVGSKLEEAGCLVRCHATTRSPIEVSDEEAYPLHARYELRSLYEEQRRTFVYDLETYDQVLILSDAPGNCHKGIDSLLAALALAGNQSIRWFRWQEQTTAKRVGMKSSYQEEDVILLLKDITGLVKPQPTQERERLIQSGTHYCEMLPLEYVPSETYMRVYQEALKSYAKPTAEAVGRLADKLMSTKGASMVLVSLARAGIPIGILLKRYIRRKYKKELMHYAISIIRGRGIDKNAMKFLLERYDPGQLVFVDGWIGKGAILKELRKELAAYPGVSREIAVAADPANVTTLCGTHEDLLIPSSCLNCTVSGLVSRTFLRPDIIGAEDFHGAVYYQELQNEDLSYQFINAIEREFETEPLVLQQPDHNVARRDKAGDKTAEVEQVQAGTGLEEVKGLAEEYGIADINLIKPGIGEATRVLLRRVPWKILVAEGGREDPSLAHILRLAEEKGVPVEEHPLTHYRACGIIKSLADA